MKSLTLNTHSWMEEHPLLQQKHLVEKIAKESYDIIALQEVNQTITAESVTPKNYFYELNRQVSIKKDNFAYLIQQQLAELGKVYFWTWIPVHVGYDRFDEGLAILSKTPLHSAEEILLSDSRKYDDFTTRKALKIQTQIGSQLLDCYSVHFSWWKNPQGHSVFSNEWQRFMQTMSTAPTLVMGDFNNAAHIKEEGYQLILNSSTLKDSFLAAEATIGEHTVKKAIDGWSKNNESLRIDYIFATPSLKTATYQIVFDGKNSPVLSDHFGIEASFHLL